MSENCPHRLIYLSVWSPVCGACWEGLRGVALPCHRREPTPTLLVISFYTCRQVLAQLPAQASPGSSWTLVQRSTGKHEVQLRNCSQCLLRGLLFLPPFSTPFLPPSQLFYHSSREVTKTTMHIQYLLIGTYGVWDSFQNDMGKGGSEILLENYWP